MPARSTSATRSIAMFFGMLGMATSVLATTSGTPRPNLFVITDQEGYGTGECLERQGGCGKIIADSFCEAKGFHSAEFYRKAAADEVTGSIASEKKPSPREPSAYIIGCR